MNRKSLTRIAFTAVAVPALAFGAPAAAMAGSYFSGESTAAGPKGAASHSVTAVAFDGHGHGHGHNNDNGHGKGKHKDGKGGHHHGGSYYKQSASWAGPHGAGSQSVASGAR